MTNEATRSLSIGRPIVVRNLFGQEKKRIGGEILSLSWDDGKGEAVGTRPRRGETCYLTVLILDFSFVIVESGSRGGG